MEIALIGTGRMGTALAAAIADRGWTVHSRFDVNRPFTTHVHKPEDVDPDVIIDFSLARLAPAHIERCAELGLPLVVGTTGWYDQVEEARRVVGEHNGSVLYAPNFSLGVAMLTRALRSVLPMVEQLERFDICVHEVHHTGKRDSPSGTALRLADDILDGVTRKSELATPSSPTPIKPHQLQVTAARIGHEFGHHTIWIDGPADRLLLSHEARSRQGFAEGALAAAEWLVGRRGFFTLDDMLDDWLAAAAGN